MFLLLADTLMPRQHHWPSRMQYQTLPELLGALSSTVGSCLAPLCFQHFSPLLLLSKGEVEPAAAGRSVGFPTQCQEYIFFLAIGVPEKSSETHGASGGL